MHVITFKGFLGSCILCCCNDGIYEGHEISDQVTKWFLDGYPLGIKSVNGKFRLPNDNQNRKELGWSISNSSIPKHVQKYVCMYACMHVYIYNMYIGWCCTFQFHYSFLRDVLYVENSPSRRDTVGQCRVTPTLFNRNCRWRNLPFHHVSWEFIIGIGRFHFVMADVLPFFHHVSVGEIQFAPVEGRESDPA